MSNNPAEPRNRRSVRLSGFDYRSDGAYFFTVVTANRRCLFGQVIEDAVVLSRLGETVRAAWAALPSIRPYVTLDDFVVMPNHVHGIVWISNVGADTGAGMARHAPTARRFSAPIAGSLSAIIGGFKAAATKHARLLLGDPGLVLWQRGFYEHVIRNDAALQRIRRYISENPKGWAVDDENPAAATRAPSP